MAEYLNLFTQLQVVGPLHDGVALPANYTLFGQVTDGLDTTVKALDALGNPDQVSNGVPPIEQIIVQSVTITES